MCFAAGFSIPSTDEGFDEIIFIDQSRPRVEKLLVKLHKEVRSALGAALARERLFRCLRKLWIHTVSRCAGTRLLFPQAQGGSSSRHRCRSPHPCQDSRTPDYCRALEMTSSMLRLVFQF